MHPVRVGRFTCARLENMKTIQIFSSFREAADADRAFYASLTAQQSLDLLLDLIARYQESMGEAGQRLERVYRVVELARR